jgi:hypothetical protein
MTELEALLSSPAAVFLFEALAAGGFGELVRMLLIGLYDRPETKQVELPKLGKFIVAASAFVGGGLVALVVETSRESLVQGLAAGTLSGLLLVLVKRRIRGGK